MMEEQAKQTPRNKKNTPKQAESFRDGGNGDSMFSPGFRSVAAMAGWDEEAILVASLVVEDTPNPDEKYKKRSNFPVKTPPTNSRRKRRAQRTPASTPITVLNLDEDETAKEESEKIKKAEMKNDSNEVKKQGEDESPAQETNVSCLSSALPCIDRLREELSCAICLEICFEPSTTPCGHSFCKKCLRSAADKCGKRCPKCRQLISNGRSCSVNTVLWNTIQLLFPQEVEARKAAGALNNRETERGSPKNISRSSHSSTQSIRVMGVSGRGDVSARRRRGMPSQDEDAALAQRLQREEFMEAFREEGDHEQQHRRSSMALARANLRAMASRAISIRARGSRPI